jgi:hypothetical protein
VPQGDRVVTHPLAPRRGRASQVAQLDRDVRAARRRRGPAACSGELVEPDEGETGIGASAEDVEAGENGAWREALLARLHRLSPAGSEEFTLYLLRTFGIELTRVGGVGDEGIDGIGLAPISAVLSSRVAVQAKRYDPTATVGREIVAFVPARRGGGRSGARRTGHPCSVLSRRPEGRYSHDADRRPYRRRQALRPRARPADRPPNRHPSRRGLVRSL